MAKSKTKRKANSSELTDTAILNVIILDDMEVRKFQNTNTLQFFSLVPDTWTGWSLQKDTDTFTGCDMAVFKELQISPSPTIPHLHPSTQLSKPCEIFLFRSLFVNLQLWEDQETHEISCACKFPGLQCFFMLFKKCHNLAKSLDFDTRFTSHQHTCQLVPTV